MNIIRKGFIYFAGLSGIVLFNCSPERMLSVEKDTVLLWMQDEHVLAVGVCTIEKGAVKDVDMYGKIAHHDPAPENTIFNVASLTKLLLSTLTLKLIDDGVWQLDEPLFHYWTDPDVADDPRNKKITTRHVLSHQTGLPNWRGHEPGGKMTIAFEPGTRWKYSGEGYEYLRKALETKFNTSMEKLVDSLILKPWGMKDTRYYWDDTMDSTRYANRHAEDGSPLEMEKWYAANASNLVLSTVEDYGKFGVHIMQGMGIGQHWQDEMIAPQSVVNDKNAFGLGWRVIKGLSNGEYALVHTGRNAGLNTVIMLLPESGRGIVVFTNGENGYKVYEKIIAESLDAGSEILTLMK